MVLMEGSLENVDYSSVDEDASGVYSRKLGNTMGWPEMTLRVAFVALGLFLFLLVLGFIIWLCIRKRRFKQSDAELELASNAGNSSKSPPLPKKKGFLNTKTPLISIKALG
ncbi:hypothetical protein QAD02_023798, partial [Eretmocerus hayati]